MELIDYIKGLRSGRKAHYIEREAMNDPFLQEALEGYESVAGNHAKQIERLKTRTIKRVKPPKIAHLNIQNWSIAATILLCISIGIVGYLLVNEQNTMKLENMQAEVREQSIPKEEIPEMSSQNENKSQEIIQTSPKESIAALTPPVIVADEVEVVESEMSISVEDIVESMIESDEEVAESAEIMKSEVSESMIDLPLKTQAEAEPEAVAVIVEADKVSDSQTSDKLITGKVVDADGESLHGVSIRVAGTDQGTVTDVDGKFNLRSSTNSQLTLDYIGFETLKIPADTGAMLIAMTENTMELSEVVVAGSSRRSRKESTVTKQETTPVPIIGMNEYRQYLRENAASSKNQQCRGVVELRFYVDENGRPKDIIVSKNLCETADNEAIRLINEGCNWTIGSQQVVIEVRFR